MSFVNTPKYKQWTPVSFVLPDFAGSGIVVGIAAEYPIMGHMYIIQIPGRISDEYPYTTFVCQETLLKPL